MMYTPPAGSYKFQHRNEIKKKKIQIFLVYMCLVSFDLVYCVYMYKWGWWNLTVEHETR